jgi:exportin-1
MLVRRDAEVLSLFATIINKLQALMEAEVPHIFEAVFEVTLDMITKNFEARCSLTLQS